MSAVMTGALAALLTSNVPMLPSRVLAAAVHLILASFRELSAFAGRLPLHTVTIGHPAAWAVAIYLGILILIIALDEHMARAHRIFLLVLSVYLLTFHPVSGLAIHFIDVGQGDGILITCEGTNLLIDGGSTTNSDLARYQLKPLLQYYGISHLDAILVSHDDADHVSGLLEFLEDESYENEVQSLIGCIVLPKIHEDSKGTKFRRIEQLAFRSPICRAGKCWRQDHPAKAFGGLRIPAKVPACNVSTIRSCA